MSISSDTVSSETAASHNNRVERSINMESLWSLIRDEIKERDEMNSKKKSEHHDHKNRKRSVKENGRNSPSIQVFSLTCSSWQQQKEMREEWRWENNSSSGTSWELSLLLMAESISPFNRRTREAFSFCVCPKVLVSVWESFVFPWSLEWSVCYARPLFIS
jgi:hypothetical protein